MASTLDTLFGPALVGIILFALTFGVFSSQLYTYFFKYPKDAVWMKCMVTAMWVVAAFQLSTNIHMIYVYLVADFGQVNKLKYATWDWLLYVACTSIIATCVQSFFARRVFILTRQPILRWAVTGIIISLSLVQTIIGFVVMAKCYQVKAFLDFKAVTWGVDLWLGCACACDVIIALAMCYFLHTSRTGIKRTDQLINRLMAYAIQTGALTSIVEIICLATFTGSQFHFGHILVVFPLSGLYSTSLMANLHARHPTAADYYGGDSTNVISLDPASGASGSVRHRKHELSLPQFATVAYTTETTLHDDTGKRYDESITHASTGTAAEEV